MSSRGALVPEQHASGVGQILFVAEHLDQFVRECSDLGLKVGREFAINFAPRIECGDEVYEAFGLTKTAFIQKYLVPALDATEVKAYLYEGRFIYSKPLTAWGPRLRTIDLVFQLAGAYSMARENSGAPIKGVYVNVNHRPPRPFTRTERKTQDCQN